MVFVASDSEKKRIGKKGREGIMNLWMWKEEGLLWRENFRDSLFCVDAADPRGGKDATGKKRFLESRDRKETERER
jgi:hypothetical protein